MEELKLYLESHYPLAPQSWMKFKDLFKQVKLKKRSGFIFCGMKSTKIGFLASGIMRGYFLTPDANDYTIDFFTKNSIVGGYASLVSGLPNTFTKQALTDCEILVADYDKLLSLYKSYPDLERIARRIAEVRFTDTEQQRLHDHFSNPDTRYIAFQQRYPGLEKSVSSTYIASYLGMSLNSFRRLKRKWKNNAIMLLNQAMEDSQHLSNR